MIHIEYGDGISYPTSNFNVIIISLSIWPIDKVLYHIFKNINYKTKVVCRDHNDEIKNIILNTNLSKLCHIHASVSHPLGSKYKSLILKKLN